MSIHDLELLADGFALGVYTALLLQMIQGLVDDRRAARSAHRRERIHAADRFHRSLYRYQRQAQLEALR